MKRFEGNAVEIARLYTEGKSLKQIAKLYGIHMETMRRFCKRADIKRRSASEAVWFGHKTGNIKHNWAPPNKGYKYVRNDGYICLSNENHPNTDSTGRLYEHRKVMSEILGRPLTRAEIVHHLNGNPSDNRKENLMIVTRHSHDRYCIRKAMQERIRYLEGLLAGALPQEIPTG